MPHSTVTDGVVWVFGVTVTLVLFATTHLSLRNIIKARPFSCVEVGHRRRGLSLASLLLLTSLSGVPSHSDGLWPASGHCRVQGG